MTDGEWKFLWWSIGIVTIVAICRGIIFPRGHYREPAIHAEAMNNLQEIGIAYSSKRNNDRYGRIPPVAIVDENGRPVLSWRVLLLPQLDQEELFEKFDLTKPWDSPENLPLVKQMPYMFASPFAREAGKQGKTPYKAIVSDNEQFNTSWSNPGEELTFHELKDGLSHTALVVEDTTNPVIWTKPEEITPGKYLQTLDDGRWFSKTFIIAFADGSVRVFQDPTEDEVLPLMYADDGKLADWSAHD